MSYKAVAAIVAAACLVSALAAARMPGLIGMFLGLSTGAFGAYALYITVLMLRSAGGQPRQGTLWTLLAFFGKFPVIGLGAYVSFRLGMPSLVCFTTGVLVVYFALVWRAARSDLYSH